MQRSPAQATGLLVEAGETRAETWHTPAGIEKGARPSRILFDDLARGGQPLAGAPFNQAEQRCLCPCQNRVRAFLADQAAIHYMLRGEDHLP